MLVRGSARRDPRLEPERFPSILWSVAYIPLTCFRRANTAERAFLRQGDSGSRLCGFDGILDRRTIRYPTRVGNSGLKTPRLLLRSWQESDRAPFAAMNADPLVMRYFLSTLSAEETDRMLENNRLHFERHGFGLWAVALAETDEFAGYIGLNVPSFKAPFTPCVEIGWRLAARFWNQGLATEGAAAVLRFAHLTLGIGEVVSFTSAHNLPSRRVMEKIGMTRDIEGDFDHPRIPKEHPLCRHVLYRARR